MKTRLTLTLLLLLSIFCLVACSEKEEENSNPIGTSSLQVTPGKLSFTAAGGTQLLTVKTTYPKFGFYETSDWIDADFKDDPTYNYITVTAEPNTKSEARSTTVRIDGADENSKIVESVNVKVEQEAGDGDTGTEFTVSSTGGKVELDDLTIDFPSGTFKSPTKVTVSEVEGGTISEEWKDVKFYKVKMNGGNKQDIKVAIKVSEKPTVDNVKIQVATEGWFTSFNKEGFGEQLFDAAYKDGAYEAQIPAMESPDEVGEAELYFSLAAVVPSDLSSARTRAVDTYQINWYSPALFMNISEIISLAQKRKPILDKLNAIIPDAIKKITDLGFTKDKATIDFNIDTPLAIWYFSGIHGQAYGAHRESILGKTWGAVYLNSKRLYQGDIGISLNQTIIHELLHHYQQFYDSRWSPTQLHAKNNMATVLNEAASVWIEGLYQDPDFATEWAKMFLPSINPEHEDVHNVLNNLGENVWEERYQNTGYGMSTLIKYLTNKFGNGIVVDIFKERKKNDDSYKTIDFIEAAVSTKSEGKLKIFTQSAYKDFVEALGQGKVYKDIQFSDLLYRNRVTHDTIGVVERSLDANHELAYFTNYAYGYGALIECLNVDTKSLKQKYVSTDKLSISIEQTTEGLTTWVYNGSNELIGATKKGSPFVIPTKYIKSVFQDFFYFVTIPDNFKTSKEILSRTVVQMAEFPNFTKAKLDYCYTSNKGDAICHWIPASGTSYYQDGEDWAPITTTFNPKDSTVTIVGSGTLPKYATPGGEDHTNSASQTYSFKFVMDIRKWGASTVDNRQFTGNVTWTTTSNTTYKSGRWNKDERTVSFSLKPVKLTRVGNANASEIEFVTVANFNEVFNSYSETLVTNSYTPPTGEDPEERHTKTDNFIPASGCEVPFTIYLYTEPKGSNNSTRRWTKSRR